MMANVFTAEKRAVFLERLTECGNVTQAARDAGISRVTVYEWRAAHEDFAADWDNALKLGLEGLEDEARRRAFYGVEKPVYQGGQKVGVIQEFSDTLAIFLLKGGMPEKYRERVSTEISGKGGGPIEHAYAQFVSVSSEALEEVERFLSDQTDDDASE